MISLRLLNIGWPVVPVASSSSARRGRSTSTLFFSSPLGIPIRSARPYTFENLVHNINQLRISVEETDPLHRGEITPEEHRKRLAEYAAQKDSETNEEEQLAAYVGHADSDSSGNTASGDESSDHDDHLMSEPESEDISPSVLAYQLFNGPLTPMADDDDDEDGDATSSSVPAAHPADDQDYDAPATLPLAKADDADNAENAEDGDAYMLEDDQLQLQYPPSPVAPAIAVYAADPDTQIASPAENMNDSEDGDESMSDTDSEISFTSDQQNQDPDAEVDQLQYSSPLAPRRVPVHPVNSAMLGSPFASKSDHAMHEPFVLPAPPRPFASLSNKHGADADVDMDPASSPGTPTMNPASGPGSPNLSPSDWSDETEFPPPIALLPPRPTLHYRYQDYTDTDVELAQLESSPPLPSLLLPMSSGNQTSSAAATRSSSTEVDSIIDTDEGKATRSSSEVDSIIDTDGEGNDSTSAASTPDRRSQLVLHSHDGSSPTISDFDRPPRRLITYAKRHRERYGREVAVQKANIKKAAAASQAAAPRRKTPRRKTPRGIKKPTRCSRRQRRPTAEADLPPPNDVNPSPVLDSRDIVMGAVAPIPQGPISWSLNLKFANKLFDRLYTAADATSFGLYESCVTSGLTIGPLWPGIHTIIPDPAIASVMKHVISSNVFQQISDVQNQLFQRFAARAFAYYAGQVDELRRRKIGNTPFTNSVYTTAEFGFCDAPSVLHRNPDVAFDSMEAVTVCGDFKKGGRLALGDEDAEVQLKPGYTFLIPGAIKRYRVTPVGKGEKIYIFRQFCHAGVFRWMDKGGRLDREFDETASTREIYDWEVKVEARAKNAMKLFSRLHEVYTV